MSNEAAPDRTRAIIEWLVGSWHLVDWEDGDRADRGNAYRGALIDEITRAGEPAAASLAAWLDDVRITLAVKVKIIRLLGEVGGPDTVERLVRVIAADPLPEMDPEAVAAIKRILERQGGGASLSLLRAWYGPYDFANLRDDPLELEIFKGVVGARLAEDTARRLAALAARRQVTALDILTAWLVSRRAGDAPELRAAHPGPVTLSVEEAAYLAGAE